MTYSSYDEDIVQEGDLIVVDDVLVEDGFENASQESIKESLENQNSKKKTKIQVDMAIDTEFKDSIYLSLQVSVHFFIKGDDYSFSYVVFNNRYEMFLKDSLTNVPEHVQIYYDDFKGDHVGLFYFYKILYEKFYTELFEYSFDFLLYFY